MKKILTILALSVLLIGMTSVSNATTVVGEICFTTGAETYQYQFERLTPDRYQITGRYLNRDDVVINGGATRVSGHLLIVNEMGIPTGGYHGSQVIDIDLSTMTGTNDQIWHNWDGSIWGSFEDLAISRVSCTAATLDQEIESPYTPPAE